MLRRKSKMVNGRTDSLMSYLNLILEIKFIEYLNEIMSTNEIEYIIQQIPDEKSAMDENDSLRLINQPETIQEVNTVSGTMFFHSKIGRVFENVDSRIVSESNASVAVFFRSSSITSQTLFSIVIVDHLRTRRDVTSLFMIQPVSSEVVINSRDLNLFSDTDEMLLYFRPFDDYMNINNVTYACALYHENSTSWNISGCSPARYNSTFHRYECNCSVHSRITLVVMGRFYCDNETHVLLDNGACVTKETGQVGIF